MRLGVTSAHTLLRPTDCGRADERNELVAELIRERFGNGIPWRELTNKPRPLPVWDDDLTKARRRRVLNDALDDTPQDYWRGDRVRRTDGIAPDQGWSA